MHQHRAARTLHSGNQVVNHNKILGAAGPAREHSQGLTKAQTLAWELDGELAFQTVSEL